MPLGMRTQKWGEGRGNMEGIKIYGHDNWTVPSYIECRGVEAPPPSPHPLCLTPDTNWWAPNIHIILRPQGHKINKMINMRWNKHLKEGLVGKEWYIRKFGTNEKRTARKESKKTRKLEQLNESVQEVNLETINEFGDSSKSDPDIVWYCLIAEATF